MAEPFLGEIRMFAGNFAPDGWLLCEGQLMSVADWSALFSLLGTTYGGDGENTFALPDLRGRVPVHYSYTVVQSVHLGEQGGVESVTLTNQGLPHHNHALLATTAIGDQNTPAGNRLASSFNVTPYINSIPGSPLTAVAVAGGSQPHENLQPFLCVNFIIALVGIYPPRS
jgi:microcystin-dependent protein